MSNFLIVCRLESVIKLNRVRNQWENASFQNAIKLVTEIYTLIKQSEKTF